MYARAEQSGNILSDIGYDARVLRVSDWQEQEVNDWRSEASGADRAVDHEGRHIAFAGGVDFNNHRAIWDGLDWVLAKHAAMVLMRGGSSKGAEFVASRWADAHNVTEMIFLRVGLVTARRRRSSATMSFCRRFRSASSRSPAAALPRTSPTRREDSEFRFGGVVAMRNLSRLLGLLIPVLRQLCDGKCPIIGPRISRRSEEGLSGNLTRRPD